jgi:hypothetical protein
MATVRLRPGTWSLVKTATATEKIRIDYDVFEMYSGQTIDFNVRKMASFDDTNITAYRKPPPPQTIVSNVGDVAVEKVSKAQVLKLGNFK